jgi:lipopolysaccharide export system permease protein
MTVLVLTLVMCAATIVQAINFMSRGVSGQVILAIFVANIPYLLSFSIPMSTLTSVLLLFSRLSLDGEVNAMKACGVSLWWIASPILGFSILLSVGCIYINNTMAPDSHFAERKILRNLGVEDPINLLDEGRFVREFPGLIIYVGKKKGNEVEDIVVYETAEGGLTRHVRAGSGTISSDGQNEKIHINLVDVQIEQYDGDASLDPSKMTRLTAERYPVTLDLADVLRKGEVSKKTKDMTFWELVHVIRHTEVFFEGLDREELNKQRMRRLVAINSRVTLALSCLSFTLVGIPLGIRSRRKESSVGIGISLAVVFIFYAFIVFARSMDDRPELRPDLIAWIPVLLAQGVGIFLIHRNR